MVAVASCAAPVLPTVRAALSRDLREAGDWPQRTSAATVTVTVRALEATDIVMFWLVLKSKSMKKGSERFRHEECWIRMASESVFYT